MGETKIEWADYTFNPWIGCTQVSAACDHCYAETLAKRYGWAKWGPGEERSRTSDANWKKPIAWNKAAAAAGIRRRVFCASLADVFDAEIDDAWRFDLIELIHNTPALDWLLLTKRPQVAKKWFALDPAADNIWLGTTVEDQKMANLRIPVLLSIPAKVHFLSCEPLLGPIELGAVRWGLASALTSIDWVIIGGESGHGARPIHPDWARSLRDQCQAAGVAFHFKQWGEWLPRIDRDKADPDWRLDYSVQNREPKSYQFVNLAGGQGVHGERVHLLKRVGKDKAGATLDGREWREFPS